MKIILRENVQKLGRAGDIVEASRGYFRNFLEPRGLAVLATKGTLKKREEELDLLKKKAEQAHLEAVALGDKISALPPMPIEVKAGETGKLYGKVTNKEVATELEKLVETPIDKRGVKLLEEVNSLGTYKAVVKLTPEVQAECTIEVVVEGALVLDKPPEDLEESEEESEDEKKSRKRKPRDKKTTEAGADEEAIAEAGAEQAE